MRSRPLHLKGVLLLAALGVLAWAPAQALAQTKAAAKKQAAQVYAPIVNELRQAHHLLAEANRDYDGHRVRAAAEVKHAIHALEPHHHHAKAKKPPQPIVKAKAPLPPVREAQRASNAQMRQAAQIVSIALAQLTSVPANKRTSAAVPRLQQALREIERGLVWAQKHDQRAAKGLLVK